MGPKKDKKAVRFIGEEPVLGGVNADGVLPVDERAKSLIPWLVASAFFMQMMDASILNTALPSIARDLGESPLRMQSAVIAYLLTVAMLIPASGWVADRFGIRRVFFLAIVVFSLGSLFCALAQNLPMLVAGRVVQGVGGAIMVPVGRLSILRITPRKDLIRVMSFISIPGLLGPLTGPTLGGLLVEYASWHWIFLINIPVGAAGCFFTLKYMPPLTLSRVFKFDWFGFFLLAAAMLTFSMGMEGMGEMGLPPTVFNGLFAAAAVALAVYVAYALRASHPLFGLGIFKNRTFSVGMAGNLVSRLGGGAMPFLMPLFLQLGMGFSPSKAGLTMIPMPLGAVVSKIFVTRAVRRLGYRNLLVGNTILLGLLLMSFSLVPKDANYGLLLLHLGCFGVVNSTQFSIMNTSTLMDLAAEEASTGNSMLSVVMQLSQSMGVSVGAFVLGVFVARLGGGASAGAETVRAFGYTFIAMGCTSICSCLVFGFMPRGLGREAGVNRRSELPKRP